MWSQNVKIAGLAALGSAIAGGAILLASILLQPNDELRKVDDETLILFLKDLKSQSYPHFFLVSAITGQVDLEIQEPEEAQVVKDKIAPEVQKLFSKKQSMVLAKYQFKQEEFNKSLAESHSLRVRKLKCEYEKLYTQSLQGVAPQFNLSAQTISHFDQDRVVMITEKVLRKATELISIVVKEIGEEKGAKYEVAIDKPEFMKKLHDLKFTQQKRQIILNEHVTQFENELDELEEVQSPTEVFSKISQFHKNSDVHFREGLKALEDEYEQIIQRLMKKELEGNLFEVMGKVDAKKIMSFTK